MRSGQRLVSCYGDRYVFSTSLVSTAFKFQCQTSLLLAIMQLSSLERLGLRRSLSRRAISTFQLTHRVEFPSYWPPVGADPKNPQPLSPRPYALHDLSNTTNFKVKSPLSIGPRQWSQVYRGSLRTSRENCKKVVLKISSFLSNI